MIHQCDPTDHAFRTAFEACMIAPADFDHRAHLRLAYIYLVDGDVVSATLNMRTSLLRFLDHHGVPRAKFHETMTQAWVMAVRHFMDRADSESSTDFIAQHPKLLDSRIMQAHYSAPLLYSDQARAAFVEPDIEPIPLCG